MNRYPLWKYILIIIVMLAGFLFALPNLYPSQPAVQVSANSTDFPLNEFTLGQINEALTSKGLKAVETESVVNDKVLIRFDTPDNQLAAAEVIKETLGKEYSTALNLAAATPSWLRGLNPMNLGLDLRGGVHFLMEVDMKSAIDKTLTRSSEEFRTYLRKQKIKYLGVKRTGDDLLIQFKTEAFRDDARAKLKREYRNEIDFIDFETEKGAALKAVQDPTTAKEILGTTATLEFRLVDEGNNPFTAQSTGRIPPGDKLFFERNGSPILLKSRVMLTGDYITDASAGFSQEDQRPNVSIVLDGKGGSLFADVTRKNIQKLMAVVFIEHKTVVTKREVINVARIQDTLSNRFQITGLDSPQESSQLALLLRAGALAAPVYIVEERTIGPSLGADNIKAGFKSVVIGFILVLIFMAIYYKVFGLVANLALSLNLVLIVAVLSMLQATLTLPGIAGIVLTVGMAVDANVLIYERIKEELRNGLTPQAAIESGYAKAFSTIADANITTLIAAIVLFGMGTGPIKGFAITLAIGIVSSMFTAIMGTRAVINLIYGGQKRLKKLRI